ncbi:MAG: hypothetical protein AB7G35_02430 [Hyphomicrobiaceae bacterium]
MAAVLWDDVAASSRRGHDGLSSGYSSPPRTVTATKVAAYGKHPLAQCQRRAAWMAAVFRDDVATSPRRGHDGRSWGCRGGGAWLRDTSPPAEIV